MPVRDLSSPLWLAPLALVAALAGCEVDSFLQCGAPCDPDAAARKNPSSDAASAGSDARPPGETRDASAMDDAATPRDATGDEVTEGGPVDDGWARREGGDDDDGSAPKDGEGAEACAACGGAACCAPRQCATGTTGAFCCAPAGVTCAQTTECCHAEYCDTAMHACAACRPSASNCTSTEQCCEGTCTNNKCVDN
jgi:hypothetical protein